MDSTRPRNCSGASRWTTAPIVMKEIGADMPNNIVAITARYDECACDARRIAKHEMRGTSVSTRERPMSAVIPATQNPAASAPMPIET